MGSYLNIYTHPKVKSLFQHHSITQVTYTTTQPHTHTLIQIIHPKRLSKQCETNCLLNNLREAISISNIYII